MNQVEAPPKNVPAPGVNATPPAGARAPSVCGDRSGGASTPSPRSRCADAAPRTRATSVRGADTTSRDAEWTGTEWRPKPLSPREVEWSGTGWRIWRVELREGRPTLRNPWTNSPQLDWWEPVHSRFSVQVAVCFWNTAWHNLVPSCQGYLTEQCTCGIRSMMTLGHLAKFLARDRQLDRHPDKAAVVGRVSIGGRVQHAIPGRKPIEGYQRSEFAELLGPLYVSPRAAHWFADLDRTYNSSRVVAPDMSRADAGQQAWLEQLAEEATP